MSANVKNECLKVKKGRVTIACSLAKDYWTYQLRNRRPTVDLAIWLVMGKPFGGQFLEGIVQLCGKLADAFSPYRTVQLNVYGPSHLHSTINPAVRTEFNKQLYKRAALEMALHQLEEIVSKDIHLDRIRQEVEQTNPFEIDVSSGQIEINGRGEVLLKGIARHGESETDLVDLRKRLKNAGLHPWDKGAKIHITLATIEDFHKLERPEKEELAAGIDDCLNSVALGMTVIDRVTLVFYSHRSLCREVCSKEMHLARGSNEKSAPA